jgi:hypothetical protein
MVKKYRIHLYILIFCLILTAGCARSGPKSGPQENTAVASTAGAVQETAAPTSTPQPTATPTPASAPSQPVAQFSGLASLDSYQSTTRIYSAGPGPDTISETISEVQFDRAAGATRNRMTTKRSDEDNPSLETQDQEQVTIGLETCSLEDGFWEYKQMEPQEKEVLSIFSKLYDVVPVISNPVFVGAETKNGVPANHFTFEVESAGAESGSVVAVNEGEYWLAVDGQYMVAYSLHLELRTGPESDAEAAVSRVEIEYSLENVNQRIEIQLPADCTL